MDLIFVKTSFSSDFENFLGPPDQSGLCQFTFPFNFMQKKIEKTDMPFLRLYIANTQMLTQYPNIYHVYILTRYTKHILADFAVSAHNLVMAQLGYLYVKNNLRGNNFSQK